MLIGNSDLSFKNVFFQFTPSIFELFTCRKERKELYSQNFQKKRSREYRSRKYCIYTPDSLYIAIL